MLEINIKFTHGNESFSSTVSDTHATTLTECMDLIKQCLMGAGYGPEIVKEWFDA